MVLLRLAAISQTGIYSPLFFSLSTFFLSSASLSSCCPLPSYFEKHKHSQTLTAIVVYYTPFSHYILSFLLSLLPLLSLLSLLPSACRLLSIYSRTDVSPPGLLQDPGFDSSTHPTGMYTCHFHTSTLSFVNHHNIVIILTLSLIDSENQNKVISWLHAKK
jgi:hypothetical protein